MARMDYRRWSSKLSKNMINFGMLFAIFDSDICIDIYGFYQHFPASSQIPDFWPMTLHPPAHAQSPKKHLKPASLEPTHKMRTRALLARINLEDICSRKILRDIKNFDELVIKHNTFIAKKYCVC